MTLTVDEKAEIHEAMAANMHYIVAIVEKHRDKILEIKQQETLIREILYLVTMGFMLGYELGRFRNKN